MFIWILLFVLLTRLLHVWGNNLPFSFDHGKDAIAVLHLIKTLSLKFIGPWTSIPGLFFGPGWYYLLSPFYWLTNGDPIAGPIAMILISLIQIWLAYKYFGIYEAFIFASAPIFIILSTSAANPFPMVLISLLILICLQKQKFFYLGFITGLGFHFSSALAIFYLLIIPLILIIKKIKIKLWKLIFGLAIPFVPQLLFEIKHNFIQTKALIQYFSIGESQHINPGKIQIVTKSIINELSLAILPDQPILKTLAFLILMIGLIIAIYKRHKLSYLIEISLFLIIPIIGFWWLHYNVWYAYGLLPMAVIFAGQILRPLPKWLAWVYLITLIISSIKLPIKQTGAHFLNTKLNAILYIYQQSDDKPFSSYHYLPNIYDYDWQYLYLWQGFKGKPLPVEFSYQPGEINYIPEKPDLLKKFPLRLRSGQAELIFLIIEKPENKWHYPFDAWLVKIKYSEIISKKEFGPELEVWEVKP